MQNTRNFKLLTKLSKRSKTDFGIRKAKVQINTHNSTSHFSMSCMLELCSNKRGSSDGCFGDFFFVNLISIDTRTAILFKFQEKVHQLRIEFHQSDIEKVK